VNDVAQSDARIRKPLDKMQQEFAVVKIVPLYSMNELSGSLHLSLDNVVSSRLCEELRYTEPTRSCSPDQMS
jgi:hypothetical protein